MQRKVTRYIFALFFASSLVSALPADGLRCGVKLISIGDPRSKVLEACGEPTQVDMWEEERLDRYAYTSHPNYRLHRDNHIHHDHNYPADRSYEVPYRFRKLIIVEEWIYNHGPHRFMDYLRIENGRVVAIFHGDYGY
ncbi:MAG: DUF2845 domain-containing protein [Desulfobacterales bacterium]|nr:MAG: DUF2845 domain-containing protein [Desulfobacterales bacterium]